MQFVTVEHWPPAEPYDFRPVLERGNVLFFPQTPIGIMFLPVRIPGWLFGIAYLGISAYLDKRGGGRVNHGAHFWGAAYGVVLTVLYCLFFAKSFNLFQNFMTQLKSSSMTLLCQ